MPGSANPAWLVGGKRIALGVGARLIVSGGLGQNKFVGFSDTQQIRFTSVHDFSALRPAVRRFNGTVSTLVAAVGCVRDTGPAEREIGVRISSTLRPAPSDSVARAVCSAVMRSGDAFAACAGNS